MGKPAIVSDRLPFPVRRSETPASGRLPHRTAMGCVSKSVPTACGPAFHPGFSVTKQAQNTQESRRGNTCCVKGCALCWSYRFARADVNNVLGLCCENTLLPLSPSSGEPAGLARCEARRPAGFPCFGGSLGIRGNSRQRCSRLLLRVIQQNCSFCDFAIHVSNRWHGVPPWVRF